MFDLPPDEGSSPIRPVVWSASSVNVYTTCHLQYYFGYVMAETGIVSEAQTVGIAVHDYAEIVLRQMRDGKPPAAISFGTTELSRPTTAALADLFDRDILPTYRDAVLIEAPFQIEVDGIPFSGVIDSVDRQDVPRHDSSGPEFFDAYILRDLKTTNKRPAAGKYWFPMVGYFLGARDLGFEIDAMQLDYIVRTQHPYYWPEVVPLPDEDDIARWASVLHDVAEGVEKADYEPTGLGTYVCLYCPYRGICGPLSRYNKEVNHA